MKTIRYKIILNILFSLVLFKGHAQSSKVILLNRTIYPVYSWDKEINAGEEEMFSGKNKYMAGDYSDGEIKFTIAIDNGQNGKTYCLLFVAPYKADSLYVGGGIGINQAPIIDHHVPLILKVGKNEFSAEVSDDNKEVTITKLTKDTAPDFELINDTHLPDVSFSLINGGKSKFTDYEHKCHYIYLEFWGTWCAGCYNAMDDLKKLNATYGDKVCLISIAFNEPVSSNQTIDTSNVRKVIELHKLDWIQGIADKYIRRLFYLNFAPNGILYDSDGNVIKKEISPKDLLKLLDLKYKK